MIEKFITEVKNRGLARTNRYRVTIPFSRVSNSTVQLTQLFCDSVTLPGMNVATVAHRISGEGREYPYERTFDTCQMSFFVDTDFDVRSAFESWIHSIVDQKTRNIAFYESYKKDILIQVDNLETTTGSSKENKTGVPSVPALYEVTLYEAYPKSIQAVQLDVGSRDIMKLNVVMQYKYWTSSISDTVLINNDVMRHSADPVERQNSFTGPGQTSISFRNSAI